MMTYKSGFGLFCSEMHSSKIDIESNYSTMLSVKDTEICEALGKLVYVYICVNAIERLGVWRKGLAYNSLMEHMCCVRQRLPGYWHCMLGELSSIKHVTQFSSTPRLCSARSVWYVARGNANYPPVHPFVGVAICNLWTNPLCTFITLL